MTSGPTISVIIPVYNAGHLLGDCLRSVRISFYQNIEVIVVDDGSTDTTTLEVMDHWSRRDRRIRVHHYPNGGLSVARNRGIEAATGSFITFVDADDTIHRFMLHEMLRAMEQTQADMAMVGYTRSPFSDEGGSVEVTTLSGRTAVCRILHQRKVSRYNNSAWGKLFRAELFTGPDAPRFTPGIAYEDLELMPRIIYNMRTIAVVHGAFYHYRDHGAAFTRTLTAGRLDSLAVTARLEEWAASTGDSALIAAARDRRLSAAFHVMLLVHEHSLNDNADVRGIAAGNHTSRQQTADTCWDIIRARRFKVLTGPGTRLKNRLGSLLSYLGRNCLYRLYSVKR